MTDVNREGFIRQRRNLIIGSLAMLYAIHADLKIVQINILGTLATLEQPYSVINALWVALCYWFVRYIQYWNEIDEYKSEDDLIKFSQTFIKNRIESKFRKQNKEKIDRRSRYICISFQQLNLKGNVSADIQKQIRNNINGEYASSQHPEKAYLQLSIYDRFIANFQARKQLYFHTTFFTEYWLPVFLSLPTILFYFYLLIKLPVYDFFYTFFSSIFN
ncbi:MAG TPA: hypothetical protein VK958_06585 [Methylophilus sp.]|uniref:hypothetical protein n=1 Tax=Methylophilus sp. TaxID=29541 RepID=UPI002BAC3CCB|nr:hypothetical protein [Methylophilus sp.]HSH86902.1 hypothetical protein [Methylophilus sp.]